MRNCLILFWIWRGAFCGTREAFLYWDTMDRVVDFFNDRENVTVSHDLWAATIIGRKSFYGAGQNENINDPSGIETIETKAFYGCVNLTAVNIPDSVTEIAEDAFDSCQRFLFIPQKAPMQKLTQGSMGFLYRISPRNPILIRLRSITI